MLSLATTDFLIGLQDPARREDIVAAARAFLEAAADASDDEVAEALVRLADIFDLDDDDGWRPGLAATACGALIERGADPSPITSPLIASLERLFAAASELARACEQGLPEDDRDERFEQERLKLVSTMPAEARAWEALEIFRAPAVALFSVSPRARSDASRLIEPARVLSRYGEAGYWLHLLLSVLDDEPFLAIEPSTGLGIEGRISGIVDNYQLHVILMHAFPQKGPSERPRVSPEAAQVALGDGPQQTEEVLTGCWNLYTWRAPRRPHSPGGQRLFCESPLGLGRRKADRHSRV